MRIALDISTCAFNRAGNARYAHSLLAALQKEVTEESITLIPLSLPDRFQAYGAGMKRKGVTLFWEMIYAPLLLPALVRYHAVDLLHLTSPTPIGKLNCPVVTMIHDLIPILFPHWFPKIMGYRLRRWLHQAALVTTHFVTNSDSTARDLTKLALAPNVPITTTYLASYLAKHATGATQNRLDTARLSEPTSNRPYILSVGTLEPRKNLATVLDAYQLLHRRLDDLPDLVIVGAKGWLNHIETLTRQLGITERVKLMGFVSDSQLQSLYQQATMLVYPSLYEGFGIPPLEAMSCGCPVITSNLSSLPEVVGEAGILIDPLNAEALADAMQQLCTTPAYAAQLREMGYRQAARFSWARCAKETVNVYREVATERGLKQ